MSEQTATHLLVFATRQIVPTDLFEITRHRVFIKWFPVRVVKQMSFREPAQPVLFPQPRKELPLFARELINLFAVFPAVLVLA